MRASIATVASKISIRSRTTVGYLSRQRATSASRSTLSASMSASHFACARSARIASSDKRAAVAKRFEIKVEHRELAQQWWHLASEIERIASLSAEENPAQKNRLRYPLSTSA